MMIITENKDIIDTRIVDEKYFIITDDMFFKNYVFNTLEDAKASYENKTLVNPLDADIIYK